MGLDIYFYKNKKEIMYFRKHSDLQGYIIENYAENGKEFFEEESYWKNSLMCFEKGIAVEMENDIKLYKEDLIEILNYAKTPTKQKYTGFFWGESINKHWYDTIEFLEKELKELKEGEFLEYHHSF